MAKSCRAFWCIVVVLAAASLAPASFSAAQRSRTYSLGNFPVLRIFSGQSAGHSCIRLLLYVEGGVVYWSGGLAKIAFVFWVRKPLL